MKKIKSKELAPKIYSWLMNNPYKSASALALVFKCKISMIYAAIREAKLMNMGILTTQNGYVPSKIAKKQDDVHYMRRCRGRRASDYISLQAALPDMEGRWKSVEDQRAFDTMFKPFHTSPQILDRSKKVILKQVNSLGM